MNPIRDHHQNELSIPPTSSFVSASFNNNQNDNLRMSNPTNYDENRKIIDYHSSLQNHAEYFAKFFKIETPFSKPSSQNDTSEGYIPETITHQTQIITNISNETQFSPNYAIHFPQYLQNYPNTCQINSTANYYVDQAGTIVFTDDKITDVNMENNSPDNDENLECLNYQDSPENNNYESLPISKKSNGKDDVDDGNEGAIDNLIKSYPNKHLSRKKLKKVLKRTKGIDLTYFQRSSVKITDVPKIDETSDENDQLDLHDLMDKYFSLMNELGKLEEDSQKNENTSNNLTNDVQSEPVSDIEEENVSPEGTNIEENSDHNTNISEKSDIEIPEIIDNKKVDTNQSSDNATSNIVILEHQNKSNNESQNETQEESVEDQAKIKLLMEQEYLLREQLIRKMLEKRKNEVVESNVPKTNEKCQEILENCSSSTATNSNDQQGSINSSIDPKQFHLVINISDSEDSDGPENDNNIQTNNVSSKQSSSSQSILQKRIKGLGNYEAKLKRMIMSVNMKQKKIQEIQKNNSITRKKIRNMNEKMEKMRRLYLLARKKLKQETINVQMAHKEMVGLKKSLIKDIEAVNYYKNLCNNIGQKIYGNKYTSSVTQINSNQPQSIRNSQLSASNIPTATTSSSSNQQMQSSNFLKYKIQALFQSSHSLHSSGAVQLLEQLINFNLNLLDYMNFFQTLGSFSFCGFTTESFRSSYFKNLKSNQTLDGYVSQTTNGYYESVLAHFNSYRFSDHNSKMDDIVSDSCSNMLNPMKPICHFDLMGSCNDPNCHFQHQKDYLFNNNREKLLEILTYCQEFSQQINTDEINKNPKLLREKLDHYLQSKHLNIINMDSSSFESICRKLIEQIMNNSKVSVSSLLVRLLPKELIRLSENLQPSSSSLSISTSIQNSLTKVPYDDYHYRFIIRDDIFNLQISQLVRQHNQNDPDSYLRNRYFAPEGVPISAQLESSLAFDPNNIQMWIKLAYYHLIRAFQNEDGNTRGYCLDSALNVLKRALECNPTNGELYEHYLLLYVNKADLIERQSKLANNKETTNNEPFINIQEMCRRILKHCSTYRLWIRYLNLCYSIEEKKRISMEIIDQYLDDKIHYSNVEERSFNLLEIIFFRIDLLWHQNRQEEAGKFFNYIFDENKKFYSLILIKHRFFAWHCFIHLMLHQHLPYHCFQFCKRGCFLQLIDTKSFIFDWKPTTSENDIRVIKRMFKHALKNCCSEDMIQCSCEEHNPMDTCFSIRVNLINLNKILIRNASIIKNEEDDDLENSYYLSCLFNRNSEILTSLHILNMFEINLNMENVANNEMLNLIENFFNSDSKKIQDTTSLSLECRMKCNYWLAFYQMKLGNINKAKEMLKKNLNYYLNENFTSMENDNDDDDEQMIQLFEAFLFGTFVFTTSSTISSLSHKDLIKTNLKFQTNEQKAHQYLYLYLSYLLFVHICVHGNYSEEYYLKLECAFSTVINSFSSKYSSIDAKFKHNLVKILWFNYLLLLFDFPYTNNHFNYIYETLRRICLDYNQSDPLFIYHLINSISKKFHKNPSNRLSFLIDFCKLNPDNLNLIMESFMVALKQHKKEMLWDLIIHIVYKNNTHIQCLKFWEIAISLSIERKDHLNVHKFFQIAISLIPYNVNLWQMFKNYETSVKHQEHLNQIKSFYLETLRMGSSKAIQ